MAFQALEHCQASREMLISLLILRKSIVDASQNDEGFCTNNSVTCRLRKLMCLASVFQRFSELLAIIVPLCTACGDAGQRERITQNTILLQCLVKIKTSLFLVFFHDSMTEV